MKGCVMEFPAYVPAGARAHIRYKLDGNGETTGFAGVNAYVREYSQRADSGDALQELRREQACVMRFAHDPRMRDVYTGRSQLRSATPHNG